MASLCTARPHRSAAFAPGYAHTSSRRTQCRHRLLPNGRTETISAASVAMQNEAFKVNPLRLMVGIGGGIPSVEADFRLEDVVVSRAHRIHSGVMQYDFGKEGFPQHSADDPAQQPGRCLLRPESFCKGLIGLLGSSTASPLQSIFPQSSGTESASKRRLTRV